MCLLGDSLLRGSVAYAVTAEPQSLTNSNAFDESLGTVSGLSSFDAGAALSTFDVDPTSPNYREYQMMKQAIIDEQVARSAGVFLGQFV